MDHRIECLKTPEKCAIFAVNAEKKNRSDLAQAARRRGIELRAESHNPGSHLEREAWQILYAYEEVLFRKHGKRVKAMGTRKMIKNRGIIATVEHLVNRRRDPQGYTLLVRMGMQDLTFEALVLRHRDQFKPETAARARQKVESSKNVK